MRAANCYLKRRSMAPVNRSNFKNLVSPVIQEQYDLGLRHDVVDEVDSKAHYGWKDLSLKAAGQSN